MILNNMTFSNFFFYLLNRDYRKMCIHTWTQLLKPWFTGTKVAMLVQMRRMRAATSSNGSHTKAKLVTINGIVGLDRATTRITAFSAPDLTTNPHILYLHQLSH